MGLIYLNFAAAWAYRTKTGRGDDELQDARERMQSHPNYEAGRHLEALALAERLVLCGYIDPNSASATAFERVRSAVQSKIARERNMIDPDGDPLGDLFAAA